jgi:hypothetical protein
LIGLPGKWPPITVETSRGAGASFVANNFSFSELDRQNSENYEWFWPSNMEQKVSHKIETAPHRYSGTVGRKTILKEEEKYYPSRGKILV